MSLAKNRFKKDVKVQTIIKNNEKLSSVNLALKTKPTDINIKCLASCCALRAKRDLMEKPTN